MSATTGSTAGLVFNNVLLCSRPSETSSPVVRSNPARSSSAGTLQKHIQSCRSMSVGPLYSSMKMKAPFSSTVRGFEFVANRSETTRLRADVERGIKERSQQASSIRQRNKESLLTLAEEKKAEKERLKLEEERVEQKEKIFAERMQQKRAAVLTKMAAPTAVAWVAGTTSALLTTPGKIMLQKNSNNTKKPAWALSRREIEAEKVQSSGFEEIVEKKDEKNEEDREVDDLIRFAQSLPDTDAENNNKSFNGKNEEANENKKTAFTFQASNSKSTMHGDNSDNGDAATDSIIESEIDDFIQSLFADREYMANVQSIFSELGCNYDLKNPYKNYGIGVALSPKEVREQHRTAIRRELLSYYAKLKNGLAQTQNPQNPYENDLGGIDVSINWKKESPDELYRKLVMSYMDIYTRKKKNESQIGSMTKQSLNEILLAGNKGYVGSQVGDNASNSDNKSESNIKNNYLEQLDSNNSNNIDNKVYIRLQDLMQDRLAAPELLRKRREEDLLRAPQMLPYLYRATN